MADEMDIDESDDYQLQLALAMSLQEDFNGGSQQSAPSGAVTAAGTAPPAASGAPQLDATQQQEEQDVQPPPVFFFPPPHQHQQHQRAAAEVTNAPAARIASHPKTLPPWAQQLSHWWQPSGSSSSGSDSGPSAAAAAVSTDVQQLLQSPNLHITLLDLPGALQAAEAMLQHQVVCPAAGVASAAPAGALRLTCLVPSGSNTATVRAHDLDLLLSTWLSRNASRTTGNGGQLALLQAAFQRSPPDEQLTSAAAKQLVLLLGLRLAHKAVQRLEQDEDDLFYETGRSTQELLHALTSTTQPLFRPFLSAMLSTCSTAAAADTWARVLSSLFKGFNNYKLTGNLTELDALMLGLDRVTSNPILLQQLASSLANEVLALPPSTSLPAPAAHAAAQAHASSSILAPLLNISSAVDALQVMRAGNSFFASLSKGAGDGGNRIQVSAAAAGMSRATGLFTCLRSYPNNAGEVDGAKRLLHGLLARVAEATQTVAKRLAGLKIAGLPQGSAREVLLSWLAAVAATNEVRCKGGEYGALQHLYGASDGFLLNLTAAVLQLTKPFVSGYLTQDPKFTNLLTKHLDRSYYRTHGYRLGGAVYEATLSGERGTAAVAEITQTVSHVSSAGQLLAADPAAASAAATFIAEVFFIGQRYLHVGLMPAVYRHQKLHQHLWEMYTAAMQQQAASGSTAQLPFPVELNLLLDCNTSQLLQPDMTADAVQFATLEIVWLAELLTTKQQPQQQPGSVLGTVPESVLGDAAAWLTFVIQQGQSEQLAAVPIGLLMRSLVTLLEHPSEVRSLLVVAKLVHLLLSMLAPQVNLEKRTHGALGRSNLSPGETALVASVLGTSAAQQQLVPALMRVYAEADFVVGLDVDVDNYDKFTMRHQIDQILEELWNDERCKQCIRQQAAAAAGGRTPSLFADYVSAVLNDLMYLFRDSLERLADIKGVEDSKADVAGWQALPDDQRKDKENFYRSQQRTATGFLLLARKTLDLLIILTGDQAIARTFMAQPLLNRTAFAVLHFLELLLGPRCQALDVKNPTRYHFDKDALMLQMVTLAGQLAHRAEFTQALAEQPDFDASILQTAVDQLNKNHAYTQADMLARVLAGVATRSDSKRQRCSPAADTTPPVDASGSKAAAAQIQSLVNAWTTAVGSGPRTYEEAEAAYTEVLEPLSVGLFDASAAGAYNSHFAVMAAAPEGDSSQKLRRLGRELRDLRSKTRLPVSAAAACYVRQDATRPDKVRCVITGPQGTPYEGGMFVFDVYFPPGYPNVPPLMVLETTGNNTFRFNPNLYADGKVCLSLLGTWHGGDEASKWNPATSSLFQILLSIQGMIFVEDPYFNEPAYDGMRGTKEGNMRSMEYNAELRVQTLRWAVLDLLKHPPPGLADVVHNHFRMLRGTLASRAGKWLAEAAQADPSGTFYGRMVKVMEDVVRHLAAL